MKPELAEMTQLMIQQTLENREPAVHEYQLSIQGELREYEARMVACGQDEVLVLLRDITERKRTERELTRAHRPSMPLQSILLLPISREKSSL
jgi:hypothetical protein